MAKVEKRLRRKLYLSVFLAAVSLVGILAPERNSLAQTVYPCGTACQQIEGGGSACVEGIPFQEVKCISSGASCWTVNCYQ